MSSLSYTEGGILWALLCGLLFAEQNTMEINTELPWEGSNRLAMQGYWALKMWLGDESQKFKFSLKLDFKMEAV